MESAEPVIFGQNFIKKLSTICNVKGFPRPINLKISAIIAYKIALLIFG
jgi:hypothetical protein